MKNIKENLPKYYLIGFLIFSVIMAINPLNRYMWFIENIIMALFLLLLIFTYKKFKFSNTSYTLILLFLILQTIGAHWTYARVPFDFFTNLFGWQRNNYDRIVHFAFGFLLAIPFKEFFQRTTNTNNKFWLFIIPILFAFAMGGIYEVIEWAFAVLSDPNAAANFLGAQGDIWDAQKDTALAGLGAFITMTFYAIRLKINKTK